MEFLNLITGLLQADKPTTALLAVILIIVFYIGKYFWDSYTTKPKINLLNHSIFTALHNYDFEIRQAMLTNKQKIVRGFIRCYVEFFKNWLIYVLENPWVGKDVGKTYNKMLIDVEACWIKDGAPIIWLDKWRAYTTESNKMIHRYIDVASDSEFYADEMAKKLLILTIAQTVFFATLKDIDVMVTEMNGELEASLDVD
jgi:hypothetical protein